MEKKKSLYDYKIGEFLDKDIKLLEGMMEHPIRLVAIGYTYQDVKGVQMETKLKHESFIEDDEENTDGEWIIKMER